jgi:hypothetical protein
VTHTVILGYLRDVHNVNLSVARYVADDSGDHFSLNFDVVITFGVSNVYEDSGFVPIQDQACRDVVDENGEVTP